MTEHIPGMVAEMGGLMKTMPFITTVFFIVGLCSLGLPGFSGFVAEMTVFMGSWQHADTFQRIATIVAAMSIVVTAVYILRAIGQTAMGPPLPLSINGQWSSSPNDATWNEKLAAIILVAGILAIGIAPGWLNDLMRPAAEEIMNKIGGK